MIPRMLQDAKKPALFPVTRSLSSRLLILTILFIMAAELLIFVPSIARYRISYLTQLLEKADLATLAVRALPGKEITPELKAQLLASVGAESVVMKLPTRRMLLLSGDMPAEVDATIDLRRETGLFAPVADAFDMLFMASETRLNIIGAVRDASEGEIEIVVSSAMLRQALLDYCWQILGLSLIISTVSAGLVYVTLRWIFVRPMRRLTEDMIAFRKYSGEADTPDSPAPPGGGDEISVVGAEFARVKDALQTALGNLGSDAALGQAAKGMSHDLKNDLATLDFALDSISGSDDPLVRRHLGKLRDTLNRAIAICADALAHGDGEQALRMQRFPLHALIDGLARDIGPVVEGRVSWRSRIDENLEVHADPDQLYRVLANLCRNAARSARARPEGMISVSAERDRDAGAVIRISDNGGGLPDWVADDPFRSFDGDTRAEGHGIGLSIAHRLIKAHGGDIALERNGPDGACFRITLPANKGEGDGAGDGDGAGEEVAREDATPAQT